MTAATHTCWTLNPDTDAETATYTGGDLPPGTFIACETSPWIEDAEGRSCDRDTLSALLAAVGNPAFVTPDPECDCADDGPFVGMAINESGNIERHDECALYDGDLEAAHALAQAIGGTVWFYVERF